MDNIRDGSISSKNKHLNIKLLKRALTLSLALSLIVQSTFTATASEQVEIPNNESQITQDDIDVGNDQDSEAISNKETEVDTLSDNELNTETETGTDTDTETGTDTETETGTDTETSYTQQDTSEIQNSNNNKSDSKNLEELNTIEEIKKLDYEYEDRNVSVSVKLPEDTCVPSDSVLVVTEITASNDIFDELTETAKEALNSDIKTIQLFDISFFTKSNEYISVDDTAEVKITPKKNIKNTEDLKVMHYEDESKLPVEISEVQASNDEVVFTTDGFSIFALVEVIGAPTNEVIGLNRKNNIDTTALGGNSYVIASRNAKYMLDRAYHTSYWGRLGAIDINSITPSDYVYHTFDAVDSTNSTYRIYTTINGTKYYLKVDGSASEGMYLHNTSVEANATIFKVEAIDNSTIYIRYRDNDSYYINLNGGEFNHNGFMMWQARDAGSEITLNNEKLDTVKYVNNLGDKEYAIISYTSGVKALTSISSDNKTKLISTDATVVDSKYVYGNNVASWKFEASDANHGKYYIYTLDSNGNKLYLSISDTDETVQAVTEKPSKPFTVIDEGNHKVTIRSGGRALDNYIHHGCFGSWEYTGSTNQLVGLYEKKDVYLQYELGFEYTEHDRGWITDGKPSLEGHIQSVDGTTQLLGIIGATTSEGYYRNLTHYTSNPDMTADIVGGEDTNNVNGFLEKEGKPNGSEYEFLGWETEVDGNKYIFNKDAQASINGDNIDIKDTEGNTVTVPSGTTLKGRWRQVRDIALFYVNYKGFINDNPVTPYDDFTPCVGIAYIYNAESKNLIGLDEDTKISSFIVDAYDATNTSTQIVLEYVRFNDNGSYSLTRNIEGSTIEEFENHIFKYLRESEHEVNLHLGEKNSVRVNSSSLFGPQYDIKWYTMKDAHDVWHIDGLVTEDPQQINVELDIQGVSSDDIDKYIRIEPKQPSDEFANTTDKLYVITQAITDLGNGSESSQEFKLFATNEILDAINKKYEYIGENTSTDETKFSWNVPTARLSEYTLSVSNSDIADYNCITHIELIFDDNSTEKIEGTSVNVRDHESTEKEIKTVRFVRQYTKNRTAILNIANISSNTSEALYGTEFRLYNSDNSFSISATTDTDGKITFDNIPVGNYILEQITVANGYVMNDNNKYNINVTSSNSGDLVVLDNNGNILYKQEDGEIKLINTLDVYNSLKINKLYTVKVVWDKDCDKNKIPDYLDVRVEVTPKTRAATATELNFRLDASNNWQATWNDYDDSNYEVKYVSQDGFLDKLELSVTANITDFTITFSPEKSNTENNNKPDDNNKDKDDKDKDTNKDKDNKVEENKNNTSNTQTNNTTGTPDKPTGDSSNLMIWTSVMLLSAIMFIVLLKKKSE